MTEAINMYGTKKCIVSRVCIVGPPDEYIYVYSYAYNTPLAIDNIGMKYKTTRKRERMKMCCV